MKAKHFFATLITFSLLFPVAFAAFNDVQLSEGSTLELTIGGNTLDFTAVNGNLQSLTVNGGSVDIVLASGSTIDITSANKSTFSYGGGFDTSFSCNSGSSVLSISSGGSSGSMTITPTGTACTTTSGGTNGSGSSGDSSSSSSSSSASAPASSSASAPVAALVTQVTAVTPAAPVVANPSPVAQLVSPVFNKDLVKGVKNDDVKRLQQLLAQDKSIYPEGLATGLFGPATERAIKKFQKKYGLPQVGRVGPATRKKLEEVFKMTQPAASVPVVPAAPAPVSQSNQAQQSQLAELQKKLLDLLKQFQAQQQKKN